MHPFRFAGHDFCALPQRAIYWPQRRALLVADLHLEKASWLARGGQMLPPYDSHATLANLSALANACDAREIWALGDSFHDPAGPGRLDDASLAVLDHLAETTRLCWIEGNHDAGADMPGARFDAIEVDGIMLRHESDPAEPMAEVSGHFHPKARIAVRGKHVTRPCIAVSPRRMILPSFGTLTGGLSVDDPAICARMGRPLHALVATHSRLMHIAVA